MALSVGTLAAFSLFFRGNQVDCGLIDRQGHETVPGNSRQSVILQVPMDGDVEASAEK